jgi:hypothetical protein
MTENETVLNSLEEKIKKIILLHEDLKNENQKLLAENHDLSETIKHKDIEINALRTKNEHLKLAKLLTTKSEDAHDAKLKVNRIVREIDKCIALLNK